MTMCRLFALFFLLVALPAVAAEVPPIPADAETTASGLATQVTTPGTGDVSPGENDLVKVHYRGWTESGDSLGDTYAKGEPVGFGLYQLLPGMREGLMLMVAGETRQMWIPEDLAYAGAEGKPAGALFFEIELVDVVQMPGVPADVAAPPADAEEGRRGLAWKVLQAGTGTTSPKKTDFVKVHYTGWTTDGKMFDTTANRPGPAAFQLTKVIKGWTEVLTTMVEGEKRRVWIPEKLAYRGVEGKPAGMLVFDIELVEVKSR
ncbi:MAG: FKBP-type peptidyl-prolyl cis-trans isomerase [Acidobacteriota bacterium]